MLKVAQETHHLLSSPQAQRVEREDEVSRTALQPP
jgi:hypothetical protein